MTALKGLLSDDDGLGDYIGQQVEEGVHRRRVWVSEVIGPAARKSCRRNTGRGRCGTVAAALVKTEVAMVLPLPAG
jgi:hypothetical protein